MVAIPILQRGYKNRQLLAETDWLSEHMAVPNVRIVDARLPQHSFSELPVMGPMAISVLLLSLSNVFMTFAGNAYLKQLIVTQQVAAPVTTGAKIYGMANAQCANLSRQNFQGGFYERR